LYAVFRIRIGLWGLKPAVVSNVRSSSSPEPSRKNNSRPSRDHNGRDPPVVTCQRARPTSGNGRTYTWSSPDAFD
jgi:hypothetical protein